MGLFRSVTRKAKKCIESKNEIPNKEMRLSQVTVTTTSSNEDWDDLLVQQVVVTFQKKSPKKKSVQICTERQINLVESYVQYASDIWWSKGEMVGFKIYQTMGIFNAGNYKALLYVQSCNIAREESINSISKRHSKKKEVSSSCVSLSDRSYESIVTGKMDGYAGIESYCRPVMQKECSDGTIRKVAIPQLIVQASRSRKERSGDKESLRSYARSLSKVDRSWAAVMGRADHDALQTMEMPSSVCHSQVECWPFKTSTASDSR